MCRLGGLGKGIEISYMDYVSTTQFLSNLSPPVIHHHNHQQQDEGEDNIALLLLGLSGSASTASSTKGRDTLEPSRSASRKTRKVSDTREKANETREKASDKTRGNSGRWTDTEHENFLKGLKECGRWAKNPQKELRCCLRNHHAFVSHYQSDLAAYL